MNKRNLSCWAVALVGYVVLVIMGNTQPITMQRGIGGPWGRFWSTVQAVPLPGQNAPPPVPPRPAPPPPPKTLDRAGAEGVIYATACRDRKDLLAPRLQRSIRVSSVLVDSVDDLPKGASRFAAAPDVPAGFKWPQANGKPLDLVAQVQLSDVAPYDEDQRLPKSGWLCFFYALGADPPITGEQPGDRASWQVEYFDGDAATLQRMPPPKGTQDLLMPFRARFWLEWTLPSLSEEPNLLDEYACQPMYYAQVRHVLGGASPERARHHLLGYADNQEGAMRPICQRASNGFDLSTTVDSKDPKVRALAAGEKDWVLLFQVDIGALEQMTVEDQARLSGAGTAAPAQQVGSLFGSSAHLFYWIREPALQAREFSGVWLVRQGD